MSLTPNPILVLNLTQEIVFPAKPDLEGPKGDRRKGGNGAKPCNGDGARSSSNGTSCHGTRCCNGVPCPTPGHLSSSKGDRCDNCENRTGSEQHHISYSVSYFNYTVCTSEEDEVDVVTVSLNRLKIRRSSRERNDKNLKDKDRQA